MGQSVRQCRSYRLALGMAVCALVVLLAGCPAGVAQQAAARATGASVTGSSASATLGAERAAKPRVEAAEEEEETAKPSKPGGEGIKIHGHWVMDVRNPDGTLVRHLDFQNSLTAGGGTGSTYYPTGDQLLVALLSGNVVAADPGIFLVGFKPASATLPANADISNLCYDQSTAPCGVLTTPLSYLANLQSGINTAATETNLVTTANFSPTVSWVLSGNFTVPSAMTSITAVQVYLALCAPTTAPYLNSSYPRLTGSSNDGGAASITPNVCVAASNGHISLNLAEGPLTSTLVPNAPQTIVPGQVITVTVTISFS